MRLRGRGVAVDGVLDLAREDLSVGVAGDAGDGRGREDDDYRAADVAGGVGGDPAVVFVRGGWFCGGGGGGRGGDEGGGIVVFWFYCFAFTLVFFFEPDVLALLVGFLVAFEGEGFDHC